MTNTKPLFNLPEKPIDKYRIDYFLISVSDYWYYINQMHAIYYINTPYEDLGINNGRGAPLVDDWMIYKEGRATGRFCGWKQPEGYITQGNCFLTMQEAEIEVIKILKGYIKDEQGKLAHINKMIKQISKKKV